MCRFFHKKRESRNTIPEEVSNDERLVRFVMSPLHFKKGRLRSNLFNPTPNTDEISVTRLDYSSIDLCKSLAHRMDYSEPGKPSRSYCGFGLLNKLIARECGAKDVRYSPTEDNPAHADIILETVRPEGPIPAEIQLVLDRLLDRTLYFEDPNPHEKGWNGESIRF